MKNNQVPPVLLLAGALVVLAIIVEIARISLFKEGEYSVTKSKQSISISRVDNTFKNLHNKFPAWKERQKIPKHKAVEIPFLSHNIIENKQDGAVKLIIFTDHSSQSAREQEDYVKGLILGSNKYNVQIVYKFMPIDENITDGGLFEQIAYRGGVYSKYKRFLNERSGNLNGNDFIDILEKAGMPLSTLRSIMRRDMSMMLKWLEADIKQAYYFEATESPTFFLAGYRLGTPELPLHKVNTFVSQLISGINIGADTDF